MKNTIILALLATACLAASPLSFAADVGPTVASQPSTSERMGKAREAIKNKDWQRALTELNAAAKSTPGLKPVIGAARDLFREPLVANEMKTFDAVVFDPPRSGAEAQAKQLVKSNVKTVVAVSCDAGSFARDAAILVDGGYRLTTLTAVDQFKWSSHIEIVAAFQR